MMGYTEAQIVTMIEALDVAKFYLPPSRDDVAIVIQETQGFLDGLLVEGRI
jgi:hypothetical protein